MKLNHLSTIVAFSSLLVAAPALQASPIYPSSDLRVQDVTGNGHGDHAHADDTTHEVLNVGDNAENQSWRAVIKFDLAEQADAIRQADVISFQATVRQRLLQVPKEWTFQIVSFPTEHAESVLISPAGDRTDDYSTEGEVVHSMAGGAIKSGEQLNVDVTLAAKEALETGVLVLRLQLDPATNSDGHEDQISFYAGSHEVNTPHLRPQLIINP